MKSSKVSTFGRRKFREILKKVSTFDRRLYLGPPPLENVDDDADVDNIMDKTSQVRDKIALLQREGEQLMKEMKDPKTEFVEAMVAKLEGPNSRPQSAKSKPRKIKQKNRQPTNGIVPHPLENGFNESHDNGLSCR